VNICKIRWIAASLLVAAVGCVSTFAEEPTDVLSESDVITRALVDELQRSMTLQMEDLERPYFIQYTVDDSLVYDISASYGALTSCDRDRSRRLIVQTRVGSYELDNTNFSDDRGFYSFGGGGDQASLPLEEDYTAIRHAVWFATDAAYKGAVETLTKKRAYLKDKNFEERPDDFSRAPVVEDAQPAVKFTFDKQRWQENLRQLSSRFKEHARIQDSGARLYVGVSHRYLVNSEGSKLRMGDSGALLIVNAECQADDGMRLSDSRTYAGETVADLPPLERIGKDIDEMVAKLTALAKAPILEQYSGPVLFEKTASPQMFRKMLAEGVVGKPEPVGTARRSFAGAEDLQKKLNHKIMPKALSAHDDPTVKEVSGQFLFGHYRYDDEGVKAHRVDLVVDGKLVNLAMSRTPTKKLSESNGHGRMAPGDTEIQPAIGNLVIQAKKGWSRERLTRALIDAAAEQDLEYGLRVESIRAPDIAASQADMIMMFMRMRRGGNVDRLGDPIYAYKVYVDDGHEELVRGCEFGTMPSRTLKKIIAVGDEPAVYSYIGVGIGGATPPSAIVAPAVLFEEIDVSKIEREHDKLPILRAPAARGDEKVQPSCS